MIIDHKFLVSLRDVIGDDIKDIIVSYNDMLFEQIRVIDQTLLSDLTAAQIHVHTLKGSSANVGAVALSNQCLKIEGLIKTKQQFKARELMPELNKLAMSTKQTLQSYAK